jgi:alanyl-tRNA synthetase
MKVPKTGPEIRQAYLDFFASKGHKVVPSSSLVPENDPTLLLANAGMNQFKPYFLGTVPFPHERPYAASCQKCFRTADLERVGYTARHHTFFEMLGNFSFGGYFKKEAIEWAWEFMTKVLRIDPSRLHLSVFESDEEAIRIWKDATGFPLERIKRLGEDSNFWTMGPTGPCGPCSEIYVDLGREVGCGRPSCGVDCDCGRFLEVWNLVFTQFDRQENGSLKPLPRPNIDTGMGLERIASVLQGVTSNYDTDLLFPLLGAVGALRGIDPAAADRKVRPSLNVIADHLRATTFLVADGVLPANEGRGYVLRRILRRAIRHGKLLGFPGPFLNGLVGEVGKQMGPVYPEVVRRQEHIVNVVRAEEEKFFETLEAGTQQLKGKVAQLRQNNLKELSGGEAFTLYDTYGFPLDLTQEILREMGLSVDVKGFEAAMESQRERARNAWAGSGEKALPPLYNEMASKVPPTLFTGYEGLEGEATVQRLVRVSEGRHEPVSELSEGEKGVVILDRTPLYAEKGGQVGDRGDLTAEGFAADVVHTQVVAETLHGHWTEVRKGVLREGAVVRARVMESERRSTMRNHTATHLLQSALRLVVGRHIEQAGSWVGPDRLRFDFTHFEGVQPAQLTEIERLVNRKIMENVEIRKNVMGFEEAKKRGALAFFSEKYGHEVRVVEVPGFSTELCGGTHVSRTGDIGSFKILSESSVASGVRRIEAVTGEGALAHVERLEDLLKDLSHLLKAPESDLRGRVELLLSEAKAREKELSQAKSRMAGNLAGDLLASRRDVKGVALVVGRADALDADGMRRLTDTLKDRLGSGVVVLGGLAADKVSFIVGVTKDLTARIKAGDVVKQVAAIAGGGGGGRPDLAQAGGKDPARLDEALKAATGIVEKLLP